MVLSQQWGFWCWWDCIFILKQPPSAQVTLLALRGVAVARRWYGATIAVPKMATRVTSPRHENWECTKIFCNYMHCLCNWKVNLKFLAWCLFSSYFWFFLCFVVYSKAHLAWLRQIDFHQILYNTLKIDMVEWWYSTCISKFCCTCICLMCIFVVIQLVGVFWNVPDMFKLGRL